MLYSIMKTCLSQMIVAAALLVGSEVWAQVSPTPPEHFVSVTPFGLSPHLELLHNTPDQLRRELLDTNTIGILAERAGTTPQQRATFVVAPFVDRRLFGLYLLRQEGQDACGRFANWLDQYVNGRLEGHTRECLLNGATNNVSDVGLDADKRAIVEKYQLLPRAWLKKSGSGAYTNVAVKTKRPMVGADGKITLMTVEIPPSQQSVRWASFDLVDGDVAWQFRLDFNSEGTQVDMHSIRFDAKEIDPRLAAVFREVEEELRVELESADRQPKLGAYTAYMLLKKEKLKRKGIEWRSVPDLNPGMIID